MADRPSNVFSCFLSIKFIGLMIRYSGLACRFEKLTVCPFGANENLSSWPFTWSPPHPPAGVYLERTTKSACLKKITTLSWNKHMIHYTCPGSYQFLLKVNCKLFRIKFGLSCPEVASTRGGGYLTRFWTGTCHRGFKHIPVPYTNFSKMYTRLYTNLSKIYTGFYTNFPKMHTRPYTNCENCENRYRSLYQNHENRYRSLYQNRENRYPSR